MRRLGAVPVGAGTAEICVWAPGAREVLARPLVADFGNRRVEFSRG